MSEKDIPEWTTLNKSECGNIRNNMIKDFDPSSVKIFKLMALLKQWQEQLVTLQNKKNKSKDKTINEKIKLLKENLSKTYKFLIYEHPLEALNNNAAKKIWIIHTDDVYFFNIIDY